MYTLLVKQDNTIMATRKERIVQRSKLWSNIRILIPVDFQGYDMTTIDVTMFYKLPVSDECYTVALIPEEELFEDSYLVYKIAADTWLTKEAGTVEFNLSFTKVEMDENSEVKQQVGKATGGTIVVAACEDWATKIADPLLSTIDQRIIQLQMLAQQIDEANQALYENQIDDLSLEKDHLRVSAKGTPLGEGVHILVPSVNDGELDGKEDGIIDLDDIKQPEKPDPDPGDDDDNGFIEL